MKPMIFAVLTGFLILSGCSVRAGNPGDSPGKFSLAGVIIGIEDEKPIPNIAVRVKDTAGKVIGKTVSDEDGQYEVESLEDGEYVIEIGDSYSRTIRLEAGEQLVYILDIVLPVPRAPTKLRSIGNTPDRLCLQWRDNSKIETGFRIRGPRNINLLANAQVYEERFDPWPADIAWNGTPLTMPGADRNAKAEKWNERFAGTYFIWAYNEFGSSVSASVEVYPLDYTFSANHVTDYNGCP